MEDPKRRLAHWWNAGHTVAVGTVCDTWQSAPRVPGSIMVLGPDGEVTGSVSGGCVEGAVYESCVDAVATGIARREHYGVHAALVDSALDASSGDAAGHLSVGSEHHDRAWD